MPIGLHKTPVAVSVSARQEVSAVQKLMGVREDEDEDDGEGKTESKVDCIADQGAIRRTYLSGAHRDERQQVICDWMRGHDPHCPLSTTQSVHFS